MMLGREEYVPPVGFAREPARERRRWIGRVLLLALVAGLGWLLVNRVINPPEDQPFRTPGLENELPAPI